MSLKATKIYARFASEAYDDFGDIDSYQEYYRKEHVDKELRAALHALWMARAERAKWVANNDNAWTDYCEEHTESYLTRLSEEDSLDAWVWKWERAEHKCLQKAKEFE